MENSTLFKKISKNIPKNVFKGLIKYMTGKKNEIQTILGDEEDFKDFLMFVKKYKNSVLTLGQLSGFIRSQDNKKYSRIIRSFR